jgi:hypothetical protein
VALVPSLTKRSRHTHIGIDETAGSIYLHVKRPDLLLGQVKALRVNPSALNIA